MKMLRLCLWHSVDYETKIYSSAVEYEAKKKRYTWKSLNSFAIDGYSIFSGYLNIEIQYITINNEYKKISKFKFKPTEIYHIEPLSSERRDSRGSFIITDQKPYLNSQEFIKYTKNKEFLSNIKYLARSYVESGDVVTRGRLHITNIDVFVVNLEKFKEFIRKSTGTIIVCEISPGRYLSRPQLISSNKYVWKSSRSYPNIGSMTSRESEYNSLKREQVELKSIKNNFIYHHKMVISDDDGYVNNVSHLPLIMLDEKIDIIFYDLTKTGNKELGRITLTKSDFNAAVNRRRNLLRTSRYKMLSVLRKSNSVPDMKDIMSSLERRLIGIGDLYIGFQSKNKGKIINLLEVRLSMREV